MTLLLETCTLLSMLRHTIYLILAVAVPSSSFTVYVSCLVCVLLRSGAASSDGSFTSSGPVCPGTEVTFNCTVVDPGVPFHGSTIWTVGANHCGLVHATAPDPQQTCGPQFSATLAAPEGDCYTSTISAIVDHADSGLPVSCYAFEETPSRLVGNASVEVIAPSPAPSYSCSLTEGSGTTTRVTLTWTEPPSVDSIDQYCITSSPEYPFARSVCVTGDMRTHQYEVQQGLEYNFTILAVNCGNQNGTETAPISVFPQVPQAPPTPEVSAVYNESTGVLFRIETTWSEVDMVTVSEQCDRGRELIYVLVYGSSSGPVANVTISSANCTNSECRHTLDVSSVGPANYTVSVAAVNVVGESRLTESRTISFINTLFTVEVDTASLSSGIYLHYQFRSEVTGTTSCLVRYGSDATYQNLSLHDQMSQNLTNGGTITVLLSDVLSLGSITVYYSALAQTESQAVSVVGFFQIGQVVSLINDSPRVEGNNITMDLRTDHPVQCSIRLATMSSPLRDCSSTSISFTNVTPDDTKPYIIRVVVMPNMAGSMKTTIRRQIWVPANPNICTVHLINDGVTVNGETATVEFASSGPVTSFWCNLDGQGFSPCSSPLTFMGLSAGSHSVKIVPSGCGRNRRSVSASFVV